LDVVLAPGFLDHVERISLVLKQRLAELKDRHPGIIEDVRGEGLLLGLKCRVPNTDLAAAARAEHLLTVPAGDNVLRLLPPLIIGESEVAEAFARLDAACLALEVTQERGAAE
ncbi:MAG: aminotransferase class III-fold pyridoxal phosphate-dependent enzyme, partial [Alsobacter sp.]